MKLLNEKEKAFCQFGDEYIETYVTQHLKKDSWNETQLHLIVETMVYFIDTYTETFMKQGYPGDAVWIFEELCKINDYVKKNGIDFDDPEFKKIEDPLFKHHRLMEDGSKHPQWLSNYYFTESILNPYNLIIHNYAKFKLEKLQTEWYASCAQKQHAHEVIHDLLATAITSIKETAVYKNAEASGHLRYDLDKPASIPKDIKEAKKPRTQSAPNTLTSAAVTPALSGASHGRSSSSDFFSAQSAITEGSASGNNRVADGKATQLASTGAAEGVPPPAEEQLSGGNTVPLAEPEEADSTNVYWHILKRPLK
jgi:hypothetical protein